MLTRRQLIKTGMMGSVVLLAAGWLATPEEDSLQPGQGTETPRLFLTAHDALIVTAIAPVMLGVSGLPVATVVAGVDQAIASLPLAVQQELRQLFDLMGNRWARRWLAGLRRSWDNSSAGEVTAFLDRWRNSPFLLLRSAYQALHALINAAWYGNPSSWAAIGYSQPAQVMGMLP